MRNIIYSSKYIDVGSKDGVPRLPILLGFRDKDDISE